MTHRSPYRWPGCGLLIEFRRRCVGYGRPTSRTTCELMPALMPTRRLGGGKATRYSCLAADFLDGRGIYLWRMRQFNKETSP
jgi:hypothetical protein